jgi:hypothetical protein
MYKDRKGFAFSSAPKGSQGFLAFLKGVNKKTQIQIYGYELHMRNLVILLFLW